MIPKEILARVRQIEIRTRSVVDSILSGGYHSVFKGRGMEFSEVRAYMQGDDVRSIDWNVTARLGEPYVKKFQEERELTVMLLVDASASAAFGSVLKYKSEIAVELCALVAFSAIKNNDRVGLMMFTSEIEKYVPPKKGKKHVLRVIRELLYFSPQKTGTNIAAALRFLNQVQRKKAVVFAVSDFIDSGYEQALRTAARRHDVIAVTLSDPREEEIPDVGLIQLRDPESGAVMLADTGSRAFRQAYAREARARAGRLKTLLASSGVDQIAVSTQGDYVEPLVRFFRKREKQLA